MKCIWEISVNTVFITAAPLVRSRTTDGALTIILMKNRRIY
ncbi:MAG: hypothetical protein ACYSW7_01490 [Planctomycetota bacterium]